MKLAVAGVGILPALLIACSPAADESEVTETPVEETAPIPAEVLGQWYLARQECYPDVDPEVVPETNLDEVILHLDPSGEYEMSINGWPSRGSFSVSPVMDRLRVTMDDTHLNFDLIEGTLQNWSEGEATYVCGNVFERPQYD